MGRPPKIHDGKTTAEVGVEGEIVILTPLTRYLPTHHFIHTHQGSSALVWKLTVP